MTTPSAPRCLFCAGETFELRAKLVCRLCGAILETCCEGGPMGVPAGGCDRVAADGVAASRDATGSAARTGAAPPSALPPEPA